LVIKNVNVDFKKGYIEDLNTLGIKANSIDVVISNCVINLSPDKHSVFNEIFRVLKPGGELYFSDVFADRRVPDNLKNDPVLCGECLAGAMYIEDFRRMLQIIGCPDYRIVVKAKIDLNNPEIENKVGMINFYSMTIRAFKLDNLEDICEDYGQVAIYKGSIGGYPHFLDLDDHHRFFTGKPLLVCGNTASMIQNTRFSKHFSIIGDRSIHFGPFDCTSVLVESKYSDNNSCLGGACC
jgi:arsenite methyltransferase